MDLIFLLPLLLAGGFFAAFGAGDDAPEDEDPDTGGGTGNGAQAVQGSSGDDEMLGGSLDDEFYGLTGDDSLHGDLGSDTLRGGPGSDDLYGGSGPDSLNGDEGDDRLWGGAGNDSIFGGMGVDTLYGGNGDDGLTGESLSGDAGDDILSLYSNQVGAADPFQMFADGGDGADTVNFLGQGAAGTAPLLDADLRGGAGNDFVTASTGGEVTLAGGAGDDILTSFATETTLMTGDAGVDRFSISANHANVQDDGAVTVTDFDPAAGETLSVRIFGDPDAGFSGGKEAEAVLQADANGTGTLLIYNDIVYAHILGLLPGDISDESLLVDLVANPGGD